MAKSESLAPEGVMTMTQQIPQRASLLDSVCGVSVVCQIGWPRNQDCHVPAWVVVSVLTWFSVINRVILTFLYMKMASLLPH